MNFKDELKQNIENLVSLNDQYNYLIDQLNQIKEKKHDIEENINDILKRNNLENRTFVLNDNKIQQKKTIQYQNLSLKYIESCLDDYLGHSNELDSKEIIKVIKNNREKKIKYEIKIY